MLSHLKEIAQIGTQLARLNDHVLSYGKEIEALKVELHEIKTSVSQTRESLNTLQAQEKETIDQLKEGMVDVKESSGQLRKAVYDFTVLKKEIQKEIMTRFEAQLKEEILSQGKELRHAAQEYAGLHISLTSTQEDVRKASHELGQLTKAIQAIKQQDLKLTEFSKQVEAHGREKIELLRKIDSLERLVSKMRRK